MDPLKIGEQKESALDTFLTDPNLQELWYGEIDRLALQEFFSEKVQGGKQTASSKGTTGLSKSAMRLLTKSRVLTMRISHDEMEVWVELNQALSDVPQERIQQLIYQALENEGITYGIRRQSIDRLAKSPLFGQNILVVKGKPPKEGKEGAVRFKYNATISLEPNGMNGYGVDPKNPDFVTIVKAGTLLCTSTKVVNDFDGINVYGRRVYPRNGGLDTVGVGENVKMTEDGGRWYSLADGEVVLQNRMLSVRPILYLKNIDSESGNICYDGSIYVEENIDEGCKVECSGNVVVGGVLGRCEVKAGDNLVAGYGIKGGSDSMITIGGSLRAPFIEFMDMAVSGDIYTDVILGGEIVCEGGIYALGNHGRIAAGKYTAREIVANEIGNQAGSKTKLEIMDTNALEERIARLRQDVVNWKLKAENTKRVLKETVSPARKLVLERIHLQILEQIEETEGIIEAAYIQTDLIRAKYQFEIRAVENFNAGADCVIHNKLLTNQRDWASCRVFERDGLVHISPL